MSRLRSAGIPADKYFAGVVQGFAHGLTPGYFAETAESTVTDEFDDDAESIRRVQAGGIEQGRSLMAMGVMCISAICKSAAPYLGDRSFIMVSYVA